jgi:hypothetical protein
MTTIDILSLSTTGLSFILMIILLYLVNDLKGSFKDVRRHLDNCLKICDNAIRICNKMANDVKKNDKKRTNRTNKK